MIVNTLTMLSGNQLITIIRSYIQKSPICRSYSLRLDDNSIHSTIAGYILTKYELYLSR